MDKASRLLAILAHLLVCTTGSTIPAAELQQQQRIESNGEVKYYASRDAGTESWLQLCFQTIKCRCSRLLHSLLLNALSCHVGLARSVSTQNGWTFPLGKTVQSGATNIQPSAEACLASCQAMHECNVWSWCSDAEGKLLQSVSC